MRLSSLLAAGLLASTAIFGAGCSTTLVRYLPAGDTTTCDAAWPGLWKASSPSSASDKPEFAWLEVSSDCKQLTFTDSEKTSVEAKTLTLITTGAGQFLSATDTGGKPECLGKDNTDCGLPLLRYELDGDEIRLYSADHKVIHDAIARGDVQGVTQINNLTATDANSPTTPEKGPQQARKPGIKRPDETFQNLLIDTPEQVGQILFDHPEFFEATPWLVLHRETTDTRPTHPATKP